MSHPKIRSPKSSRHVKYISQKNNAAGLGDTGVVE